MWVKVIRKACLPRRKKKMEWNGIKRTRFCYRNKSGVILTQAAQAGSELNYDRSESIFKEENAQEWHKERMYFDLDYSITFQLTHTWRKTKKGKTKGGRKQRKKAFIMAESRERRRATRLPKPSFLI